MITQHRIVFVGGLHRSGTSLLARLLSQHPDASGFHDTGAIEDEGQHLQSVYSPAKHYGGVGRFGFDPRAHLTEDADLVSERNRKMLWDQWSCYWDLSRRVLVEKSPPNLIRGRFLQALFPDTHFVFILRHPIAVAMASTKWATSCSIARLIRHWVICHTIWENDVAQLGSYTVVKYEELVSRPQHIIQTIWQRLGLAPYPVSANIRCDVNREYFSHWWHMFRRYGAKEWLGSRWVALTKENDVRRFGYSVQDPELLAPIDPQIVREVATV